MPKLTHPLTDIQVRNAKAKDKEYKLSDTGGLYLLVKPSGGKLWRMTTGVIKQTTGGFLEKDSACLVLPEWRQH